MYVMYVQCYQLCLIGTSLQSRCSFVVLGDFWGTLEIWDPVHPKFPKFSQNPPKQQKNACSAGYIGTPVHFSLSFPFICSSSISVDFKEPYHALLLLILQHIFQSTASLDFQIWNTQIPKTMKEYL